MSRTRTAVSILTCLLLAVSSSDAFATRQLQPQRAAVSIMAKRRGGLKKEMGAGNSANVQSMSGGTDSGARWVPVTGVASVADLPTQEEGKVGILETGAPALIDKAANPMGAVAVVRYGPNTYCTSISCASCKIPMTKARVLEPLPEETGKDPRIACDFCSATYNLRTGERVTTVPKGGIMGGIVKGLFSAQDENPLPVYELGESKGKVVINVG